MVSSATPGIYMPLRIDGRMLMDGGIVEDIPISPLRAMGAEHVIAVNLSAERKDIKPNDIIDILFNAFDIAIDENTKAQVRDADVLIEPRLSDFLRIDTSQIDALIAEGYLAAKERIERMRAILKSPLAL